MMLFGSCFSENIGKKLLQSKFQVDVNPFGILYNPYSISAAIQRLLSATPFEESDLLFSDGLYHSLMHHGHFSAPDKATCLRRISERFESAVLQLKQTDLFLITFGSAYLYQWKENGKVVANCHKLPARLFRRFRLSVEEITEEWEKLISMLISIRPDIKIVFTVSPIRHWKEGAHENQISKSILHMATDNLEHLFPGNVRYFPAYEIMIDELRDYRFYDDDMIHPSSFAIDYIWQLFSNSFFSEETIKINREWEEIRKALEHRPFYPNTEAHDTFIMNIRKKWEDLTGRYPEIFSDHFDELPGRMSPSDLSD